MLVIIFGMEAISTWKMNMYQLKALFIVSSTFSNWDKDI